MPVQGKGLEFQFCREWSGWDTVDTFCLQFYDVVLLPEVAKKVGRDTVDVMTVCGESCTVSFWVEDELEVSFSFKVEIV